MDSMVIALLGWIVAETGLSMPPPPPVVLVSPQRISELTYDRAWQASDDIRAIYDRDAAVVYLRNDCRRDELRCRATLLHELAHHTQAFNRVPYGCSGNLEPQAYDLTVKWLRQQGVADPYAVLGIDEFTIMFLSMCIDWG